MLASPRLKANLRATTLDRRVLFLMGEHTELVFEGESFVVLAGLLDGRRSVGEVLGEAAKRVPWPAAYAALAQLERKGCLAEGEPAGDAPAAAFWDAVGGDPTRLSPIALRVFGGLPEEPLRHGLARALLREEPGGVVVAATTDYLLPELSDLNAAALAEGRPWALFKPAGTVLWVGPLFRPGVTGCWQCLAQRLTVNRQVEHFAARRSGRKMPLGPARGFAPSSLGAGTSWAATALARALAQGEGSSLDGRLLTFDLVRREMAEHVLVRRPQCPACGDAAWQRPSGPVVLAPRPRAENGERAQGPAETFESLRHHVSPHTGIVTALTSREPGGHGLTHSYVAGHYFPMTTNDLSALRVNLVARSGGKGATELQAKTGALCEALERYSGIAWGDEVKRRASWRQIAAEAVHPQELALFSEKQYEERERWNATNVSDYHDVPPRLGDDAEVSWTPAWSLVHGRARYVPTAYCFYGFRDPDVFFTRCDSNGCAAGSSLEEAILYGFLELVERDAVALWWYNRVRRPAVDADGFGLSRWARLAQHYREELGRDLFAIDITSDLGIPVLGVVSRRLDGPTEDIIVGFAAHLDPRAALLRALEEATQYLPSVRDRAPDGSTIYRLFSEETQRWWKTATYENQPWLLGDPSQPVRRLADFASRQGGDVSADVAACVAAAAARGLDVLVVDQSRPDVGLPVAKVIVPGLRHFWRRLAPGRLYDVPVAMGWLPRPRAEDELNPVSCFV